MEEILNSEKIDIRQSIKKLFPEDNKDKCIESLNIILKIFEDKTQYKNIKKISQILTSNDMNYSIYFYSLFITEKVISFLYINDEELKFAVSTLMKSFMRSFNNNHEFFEIFITNSKKIIPNIIENLISYQLYQTIREELIFPFKETPWLIWGLIHILPGTLPEEINSNIIPLIFKYQSKYYPLNEIKEIKNNNKNILIIQERSIELLKLFLEYQCKNYLIPIELNLIQPEIDYSIILNNFSNEIINIQNNNYLTKYLLEYILINLNNFPEISYLLPFLPFDLKIQDLIINLIKNLKINNLLIFWINLSNFLLYLKKFFLLYLNINNEIEEFILNLFEFIFLKDQILNIYLNQIFDYLNNYITLTNSNLNNFLIIFKKIWNNLNQNIIKKTFLIELSIKKQNLFNENFKIQVINPFINNIFESKNLNLIINWNFLFD